jgi:hypothetical protein
VRGKAGLMRVARPERCARQGSADSRGKAGHLREAIQGDARGKAEQMPESKQGRYAMQGKQMRDASKAYTRCKASQMRYGRLGKRAMQFKADALYKARQMRNSRHGI